MKHHPPLTEGSSSNSRFNSSVSPSKEEEEEDVSVSKDGSVARRPWESLWAPTRRQTVWGAETLHLGAAERDYYLWVIKFGVEEHQRSIQTKTANTKSLGLYECLHCYRFKETAMTEGLMDNLWVVLDVTLGVHILSMHIFVHVHTLHHNGTILTREQNLLFWRKSINWKCHVRNQLGLTRKTVVEVIYSLRPPQHCK